VHGVGEVAAERFVFLADAVEAVSHAFLAALRTRSTGSAMVRARPPSP
jgi:hypothetical protein